MKRYLWLGIPLFILFVLASTTPSVAQTVTPGQDDERYFPETGHTVSGDFLFAWESVPNPELIYGFPITAPFQDETSGRLFQYFERARFELFPEKPPELRVYITPLGYLIHKKATEFPSMGSVPGCRYFAEAGKSVCYNFLDFYNANGGVAQFGYPVTNFQLEDGWIVQYFQRARFEWHPELPIGQKVKLTDLGKRYFQLVGENPKRFIPTPPSGAIIENNPILSLDVRASMKYATTHGTDEQTVYITVHDQKLQPVADAQVSVVIFLPSGKRLDPIQLVTGKNGITSTTFSFENQPPGMLKATVIATQGELRDETITFSYIWW